MKRLLLFLMCIACIGNANAIFKFGMRGGVSSTSAKIDFEDKIEFKNTDYYVHSGDAKIGYHIGLMTQVSYSKFYVQPEFLFTSIRNEYSVQKVSGSVNNDFSNVTEVINRFDIPITMGMKLGPLRIGIGPVASKILTSTSKVKDHIFNDTSTSIKDRIDGFTWGYQLGLGFDLVNVAFDIKYEGSLGNIGNSIDYNGNSYNLDSRPKQLIFSIGYYISDLIE